MATVFTKIINGEITSTNVYEDEHCLAFLDIEPITKGHTLLVPKKEYQWMEETPDELLCHLFKVAKQLMQQMKEHLGAEYVQLNVEGIEVPHFHIHLIPNSTDNKIVQRQHVSYDEGEAEQIAKKITGK